MRKISSLVNTDFFSWLWVGMAYMYIFMAIVNMQSGNLFNFGFDIGMGFMACFQALSCQSYKRLSILLDEVMESWTSTLDDYFTLRRSILEAEKKELEAKTAA